jgi:hypothetical protein
MVLFSSVKQSLTMGEKSWQNHVPDPYKCWKYIRNVSFVEMLPKATDTRSDSAFDSIKPCLIRLTCFLFEEIDVCVLREEGCNGDREMAAALHLAGFRVWDVTMTDLIDGRMTVDRFRGVVFPGGFSYAGAPVIAKKISFLFFTLSFSEDRFSFFQLIRKTSATW